MVNNQFIACEMCNTKINLRIQFGYYNIPFNLKCPECKTHIHGVMILNQNGDNKLKLVNAVLAESSKNGYYCAELSAEFPTRKLHFRDEIEHFDVSPFIRNMMFFDDMEQSAKLTSDSMKFANYLRSDWNKMKVYYDLFWNEKRSVLYPKISNEIKVNEFIPLRKIENDLDVVISLHQLFFCTSGISSIESNNSLSEYSAIGNLLFSLDTNEILRFINNQSIELSNVERKCFSLIDKFSDFYEQLVPVVSLRNANRLDRIDREVFGIMTANFDDLTDFYAKSYEWILDNSILIAGLNNIISRNDFNVFFNGKTFDDFQKLNSKFSKLTFIDSSEPFSKPTNNLNNKIRNAIQHFDCEIDYVSQKAIFTDTHKGNKRTEAVYLIDFAVLCLENFSILIYLLEITYNLRKILLISTGNVPSTKKISILENKLEDKPIIRRKGPCPCGSKKKFKNCCEGKE